VVVVRAAGIHRVAVVREESRREEDLGAGRLVVVVRAGSRRGADLREEGVIYRDVHLVADLLAEAAMYRGGRREAGRLSAIVRRAGGRTGLSIAGRRTIGAGAGIILIIAITIILTSLTDGDRPGIRSAFFCPRLRRAPSSLHIMTSTTGTKQGCTINLQMEALRL
jgi:hypothetical protein